MDLLVNPTNLGGPADTVIPKLRIILLLEGPADKAILKLPIILLSLFRY